MAAERDDIISYGWALAEWVEAGVRAGNLDEAGEAFDRLCERTRASGTDWALGVEARCRGLLNDDEASYLDSIERLAHSRAAVELAYLTILTRRPTPGETTHFAAKLAGKKKDRSQQVTDLSWTLLNSTEFSWNH